MKQIKQNDAWNAFVTAHDGHPLQYAGWGGVKARYGWKVERYTDEEESWGAQVLIKILPWPLRSFAYVPRGPVGKWDAAGVDQLALQIKKRHRSVVLSIEPHQDTAIRLNGWRRTPNTVLLPRTLVLDVTRTEDVLLSAMAKKTRQYIRKSSASVEVRPVLTRDEARDCLDIYHQTAQRAGFSVHGDDYYLDMLSHFHEGTVIYGAYENDQLVAFLWLAVSGAIAFELYGGVSDRGQALRANYALKWETIQAMKRRGCKQYDFNGLLNDGISTFKQSFSNHETQLIGTFDKPLSGWYFVWRYGLPFAKKVIRTIKRR